MKEYRADSVTYLNCLDDVLDTFLAGAAEKDGHIFVVADHKLKPSLDIAGK